MKNSNGQVSFVILAVYVDDMIPVSNDINFLNAEKAPLCKRLEIIDQGEATLHFRHVNQKGQKESNYVFWSTKLYRKYSKAIWNGEL